MSRFRLHTAGFAALLLLLLGAPGFAPADPAPPTSRPHVEAALENIETLDRPDQDGFATVWDGNRYIQCGRLSDRRLRCEAAGALMQPSLAPMLVPARIERLKTLGWRLDPSFGNYVQIFPAKATADQVADKILQTLSAAYDADLDHLEVETDWIASEPCPPRNGPGQNLAGMINAAPAMAATAVHACAYVPESDPGLKTDSTEALVGLYGARVTGEIQRLRVNIDRDIFVIFDTGIGYIQCQPQAAPAAIYCEAQSAYTWPALTSVLTADRIARLHAAGYADPGRSPNYWKAYPSEQVDDATIAREVLTLLHDVYGYRGSQALTVKTEADTDDSGG